MIIQSQTLTIFDKRKQVELIAYNSKWKLAIILSSSLTTTLSHQFWPPQKRPKTVKVSLMRRVFISLKFRQYPHYLSMHVSERQLSVLVKFAYGGCPLIYVLFASKGRAHQSKFSSCRSKICVLAENRGYFRMNIFE